MFIVHTVSLGELQQLTKMSGNRGRPFKVSGMRNFILKK